jgi:hypothetical protein
MNNDHLIKFITQCPRILWFYGKIEWFWLWVEHDYGLKVMRMSSLGFRVLQGLCLGCEGIMDLGFTIEFSIMSHSSLKFWKIKV